MKKGLSILTLLMLTVLFTNCGVKGKPSPPLTPTPIGRGEPGFSKAAKEIQNKKKPLKPIPDDFEDDDRDEP